MPRRKSFLSCKSKEVFFGGISADGDVLLISLLDERLELADESLGEGSRISSSGEALLVEGSRISSSGEALPVEGSAFPADIIISPAEVIEQHNSLHSKHI